MTDTVKKPSDPARLLGEAELLLREGLKRIASAQSDLPDAQSPLEEALRLTEEQAMATIAAVERAQEAVQEIRRANGTFIDGPLDHIDSALGTILASQQGQDLAGQRLKKAIALLHAVENRIRLTLDELGLEGAEAACATAPCTADERINQDDVDALLAELGI